MTQAKHWELTGEFNGPMGRLAFLQAVDCAAAILKATPAEGLIPGLWNAPGHPELTTNQLLQIAARQSLSQRKVYTNV